MLPPSTGFDDHAMTAPFLQVMLLPHLQAAISESWTQNLIWSMVTGNKHLANKDDNEDFAG